MTAGESVAQGDETYRTRAFSGRRFASPLTRQAFGEDSTEKELVGLKRASERKRPRLKGTSAT